ncbi:MAG: glycosyltransferase [Myxococcota bacterium]
MTPHRICHVASGDLWAGAEVQAYEMMAALHGAPEFEVSAIVLNDGPLRDALRAAKVPTTLLPESSLTFDRLAGGLRRIVRRDGIQLLHSHRYKENLLVWAGTTLMRDRPKRVQTVHGAVEPFSGFRGAKMKAIRAADFALARSRFDLVHTVSHDLARRLEDELCGATLTTIHNAVRLDGEWPSPADARRELAIERDALVVGALGRLEPVKNIASLLRVLKQMNRPHLVVLIAGDGSERAELERLAQALGIAAQVRFLGFRDDVRTVLAALDVYVMCSHHEGIPTSLLEAMASELPCVCTAVGGIVEVVDESCGVLVAAGDENRFAGALEALLRDRPRRLALGQAAKTRVHERFSVAQQSARLRTAYLSLF